MKGYWFDVSSGWRDEDNDVFYEGDRKVLIGRETFCCHNEDYSCFIDEDGWTRIECEGYRCGSCGTEYSWDNNQCTDHMYSYTDKIEKHCEDQARRCCGEGKSAEPSGSADVGILSAPRAAPERKVITVEF